MPVLEFTHVVRARNRRPKLLTYGDSATVRMTVDSVASSGSLQVKTILVESFDQTTSGDRAWNLRHTFTTTDGSVPLKDAFFKTHRDGLSGLDEIFNVKENGFRQIR